MLTISKGISANDRNAIEAILRSTGFFYEFEIDVACELADETIKKGEDESGYFWMKIEDNDGFIAFAMYGKNEFSTHSWELYWIAVHTNSRNKKLGSKLLKAVEEDVKDAGGKILWIETSGRPLYAPTEAFYQRNGYTLQASLKDFYAAADPKQIYAKIMVND
jgi:ribosomal protein S18 acetylase RimI-like enzyme